MIYRWVVEWITSNSTITTISVDATGSNVRITVYIYGVFYSQEDTNYPVSYTHLTLPTKA